MTRLICTLQPPRAPSSQVQRFSASFLWDPERTDSYTVVSPPNASFTTRFCSTPIWPGAADAREKPRVRLVRKRRAVWRERSPSPQTSKNSKAGDAAGRAQFISPESVLSARQGFRRFGGFEIRLQILARRVPCTALKSLLDSYLCLPSSMFILQRVIFLHM